MEAPGIEAESGAPVSTSFDHDRSNTSEKEPLSHSASNDAADESTRINPASRESVSGVRGRLEEVLRALDADQPEQAKAILNRVLGAKEPEQIAAQRAQEQEKPSSEFDQELQAAFDAAFPPEKDS